MVFSVGVSTCFYYIAYCDDVMEKVCQLDSAVLDQIVEYVAATSFFLFTIHFTFFLCSYLLWCLEHSYESGMASSAMFFTHALYYRAILDRFDQRDGLRKLYNYVNLDLPISLERKNALSDFDSDNSAE